MIHDELFNRSRVYLQRLKSMFLLTDQLSFVEPEIPLEMELLSFYWIEIENLILAIGFIYITNTGRSRVASKRYAMTCIIACVVAYCFFLRDSSHDVYVPCTWLYPEKWFSSGRGTCQYIYISPGSRLKISSQKNFFYYKKRRSWLVPGSIAQGPAL